MAAMRKRLIREQNDRAWLAWHIAALPRLKKFPALKDMMTPTGPPKRQTPEELEEMIKVAFGFYGTGNDR